MTTRGKEIAAAARDCVGTPFRAQGRVPGRGLDCAGVIVHAGKRFGFVEGDETGYSLTGNGARIERALARAGLVRVKRGAAQVGDVLVFDLGRGLLHLAIRSEHGLIHAHRGLGRVVEHGLDDSWQAALVAVWRFPGHPAETGEGRHG